MKIILASGSPRRKELLELITPKFEVIVRGEDESLEEGLTLYEQSIRLAYNKAKDIYEKTNDSDDKNTAMSFTVGFLISLIVTIITAIITICVIKTSVDEIIELNTVPEKYVIEMIQDKINESKEE